ncbi:MAG: type II toxin-antitoxin system VapC family toxin [Candidatus Aminicenantaceae bacterium]
MNQVVIDASVVLKWYLDDEELGTKALNILTHYVSDNINLIAPSLIEYEVMNGLKIAQKRGRIDKESLLSGIEGFFNLEITVFNASHFSNKTLDILSFFDISSYDASYLALAENEKSPFVTADKVLYNKVHRKLKYIKWLEEF